MSKPLADVSSRQQVLQIDVHAQQVAHRVLVLGPVEPAQDNAALRAVWAAFAAAACPPIQSVRASTSFAGGRGFSFGGIVPDLTCSSTASHRSRLALSQKSCVRLSQAELALGLLARVTGLAVLGIEWFSQVIQRFGTRFGGLCRCAIRNQTREYDSGQNHAHPFSIAADRSR